MKSSVDDTKSLLKDLKAKTGRSSSELINLLQQRSTKRGRGASKGFSYERSVCKELSLWWTDGERDDVFWRTSGSGARATTRMKQGKTTRNAEGDIGATCIEGRALLEIITFEIKRGYNSASPVEAIIGGSTAWIDLCIDAINAQERAGSKVWALIHKRDQRVPMVWVPVSFMRTLPREYSKDTYITCRCWDLGCAVLGMPLTSFFEIPPNVIRESYGYES